MHDPEHYKKYKIVALVDRKLREFFHVKIEECLVTLEKDLLQPLDSPSYDPIKIIDAIDLVSKQLQEVVITQFQSVLLEAKNTIQRLKGELIFKCILEEYKWDKSEDYDYLLSVTDDLKEAILLGSESAVAYLGKFWLRYLKQNSKTPEEIITQLGVENPLELIISASNKNNVDAMILLADLYSKGELVPYNKVLVEYYILEACRAGAGGRLEGGYEFKVIREFCHSFSAEELLKVLTGIAEGGSKRVAFLLAENYSNAQYPELDLKLPLDTDRAIHFYTLAMRYDVDGSILDRVLSLMTNKMQNTDEQACLTFVNAEVEKCNPTVLYELAIASIPESVRQRNPAEPNALSKIFSEPSMGRAVFCLEQLIQLKLYRVSKAADSLLQDINHPDALIDRLSRENRISISRMLQDFLDGGFWGKDKLSVETREHKFHEILQDSKTFYGAHKESCKGIDLLFQKILTHLLTKKEVVQHAGFSYKIFKNTHPTVQPKVADLISSLELPMRRALGGIDVTAELKTIQDTLHHLIAETPKDRQSHGC
jgi:hypothetical protein